MIYVQTASSIFPQKKKNDIGRKKTFFSQRNAIFTFPKIKAPYKWNNSQILNELFFEYLPPENKDRSVFREKRDLYY